MKIKDLSIELGIKYQVINLYLDGSKIQDGTCHFPRRILNEEQVDRIMSNYIGSFRDQQHIYDKLNNNKNYNISIMQDVVDFWLEHSKNYVVIKYSKRLFLFKKD